MILDPEFWQQLFADAIADILAWLPNLVGALALLLIGWLMARLVQFILTGLLGRVGLDKLAERTGLPDMLEQSGFRPSVAALIARLVYWLVLLVFIIAAAESLGLPGVGETLGSLVAYLPNVLAAALILLFGFLISRVVGDSLGLMATQAGVTAGPLLGRAVRYILIFFAVILALDQLGIETSLLVSLTFAIVAASALALAIAFGFGSRDLARNIMAGFHAKDTFEVGQNLRIRGFSGRLVAIGAVKSVIETETGLVSLPNSILTEEEVTVVPDPLGQ